MMNKKKKINLSSFLFYPGMENKIKKKGGKSCGEKGKTKQRVDLFVRAPLPSSSRWGGNDSASADLLSFFFALHIYILNPSKHTHNK